MKNMSVSVALTTFNGEKYVRPQLDSILSQLSINDEIIVCDDGSKDCTLQIIKEYARLDRRVKLYENSNLGVVKNFEDAIIKCNNDIIFLSDQDDIWHNNKIETVKKNFKETSATLILHNAVEWSEAKGVYDKNMIGKMKHGVIRNLLNSCYWGCCMAFKKELKNDFLPFPGGLMAHDQWIGLIAEKKKKSLFLKQNLTTHRIHDNNVTTKLSINKKIDFRKKIIVTFSKYVKDNSTKKYR